MKVRFITVVSVVLMLIMGLWAQASAVSAYSTPLSWNVMTMPSTTYDPVTNKLIVEAPGVIPVLGTNTSANGNLAAGIGRYDPAQPWNVLNGTAFSRQLGWNDPNYAYADIPANDPSSIIYTIKSIYGPGAGIWIDCTGKPPELNTYLAVGAYGVNGDNSLTVDASNPTGYPYSGIFGTTYTDFVTKSTVVSPTRWQWDGMMDHNTSSVAFSALTGPSQLFFANYTVYIGDAAGNELRLDAGGGVHAAGEAGFDLLPSASATVTWQWKGPAFVFTSQTGVPTGAVVESDPLRISGITGSQAIAMTGGEYAISTVASTTTAPATWGAWTAAPGTIAPNYWVKVRQTAAATPGTLTVATLAIPAIPGPGEFRVTTAGVPNADVTLDNLSQTYDGTARSVTVTTTPPGLPVAVTYDGSDTPPTSAGSYAVVATVTDPAYTGSASGTLVIDKAILTVTANDVSRAYGTVNPIFDAGYGGFVNGETVAVLTGAPALTTIASTASSVGLYPITAGAGSLTAANYRFTFVNGTLTVHPVPPGAPTDVVAAAGDAEATVTFAPPVSDGGSAITGYTVISNPPGGIDLQAGSTVLSHRVTGLVNGAFYTFVVTATTSAGESARSASSNSVSPVTLDLPVRMNGTPYPTISSAYEVAPDTGVTTDILLRQGFLDVSFSADRTITVALKGGYDPHVAAVTGETTLQGPLTIKLGRVIIDRLTVR